VKNPNGKGSGWIDKDGNVWVPSNNKGNHNPHWDVQFPGGGYKNVYPVVGGAGLAYGAYRLLNLFNRFTPVIMNTTLMTADPTYRYQPSTTRFH